MVKNDCAVIPVSCDGSGCNRSIKIYLHEVLGGSTLRFSIAPYALRNELEQRGWVCPNHTPDRPGGKAYCPDCKTDDMMWGKNQ